MGVEEERKRWGVVMSEGDNTCNREDDEYKMIVIIMIILIIITVKY